MSENLKILVLNYEYPPIGGGGGVISKYISEGLAQKGNQITIITTWLQGLEEVEKNNSLKIIRLKSKRKNNFRSNPTEMLSWIKHSRVFLSEYCKTNSFDICVANFVIPGGSVAKFLLKDFNIPYIVISHGHDIPWVKPASLYFLHFLNYNRIKNICNKASSICVQSEMMKSNLEKLVGASSKNVLIPNGYDSSLFCPDYSKRPDNLKILFTGRLVKQKNPITFLKAIYDYYLINKNITVSIIGDGPLRKETENYISRNNLNDIVKLKGKISYTEVADELKSSHILVSSSISEGMSISLIEALACGVYCVVTPTSGTKELISSGKNGEFVDFKSPKQIVNSIVDYYEDKYLNNYTIDSEFFDSFKEKFSWHNIVEEYQNLTKTLKVKN